MQKIYKNNPKGFTALWLMIIMVMFSAASWGFVTKNPELKEKLISTLSKASDFVPKNIDFSIGSSDVLWKINSFGWEKGEDFNSVIFDGENYVAVWSSVSDLSSLWGNKNNGPHENFIIAKFDKNLKLLNINNFNNDGDTEKYAIFSSVAFDGSNYVAVGKVLMSSGNSRLSDFVIAKFDTDLNLQTIDTFWKFGEDSFSSIIYDGENYVAVWTSASNLGEFWSKRKFKPEWIHETPDYDFVIAKFDTNIKLLSFEVYWQEQSAYIPIGREYLTSVIYDGENYVAVGKTNWDLTSLWGWGRKRSDVFVIAKFDTNLKLKKINNFWGDKKDLFNSLIYDGENYIAVGFSASDLTSIWWKKATWDRDFVIAKFDANLSLVSINNLWWTHSDFFNSVAYDGEKYIIIGGSKSDLTELWSWSAIKWNTDYVKANFVTATFNKDLKLTNLQNPWWESIDQYSSIIFDGTNHVAVGNSRSDITKLWSSNKNQWSSDFVITKF